MNLGKVAHILAGFAVIFSLFLGVPLLFSILWEEPTSGNVRPAAGYIAAIAIGVLASAVLWLAGRGRSEAFYRRESLAVVGLAWLLASALGAQPFVWSGALGSVDALFETVSGLTTTGASILGNATIPIESLPPSLLLWRAMLHWLGGIGVVVVFVVLLPAMGVTGKNLLSLEQGGFAAESVRPRLQKQARTLFLLYCALTLANIGLLMLAGLGGFDAVCHAFATIATGGFSTKSASIAAFDSVAVELVTIGFMFIAGCNFALLLSALARERGSTMRELFGNPEFRLYFGLTAALIIATTAILRVASPAVPDPMVAGATRDYTDLSVCLRDASFQIVSLLTSTGFSSADYQYWPGTTLLFLLLCMLVGACSGSTAGGIKVLRLLVAFKLILYAIHHFLRPNSVEKVKVGHDALPNRVISAILALILMWIGTVAVGTLALALDPRLDLLASFSTSASLTGCTGPAMSQLDASAALELANPDRIDVGPFGGFGQLWAINKLILCLQMLLGRLEILTLLVLLLPGFWRR